MSAGVWVGFRVGGAPLAVEAAGVRAVSRAEGLWPVPFSRRSVAGVLLHAGRAVAVLDLGRVPALWNEVPPPGGGEVIVLGVRETEAGILADGAESFEAEASAWRPGGGAAREPSPVREAILWGTLRARGTTYTILKVEAALAAAGVPLA